MVPINCAPNPCSITRDEAYSPSSMMVFPGYQLASENKNLIRDFFPESESRFQKGCAGRVFDSGLFY